MPDMPAEFAKAYHTHHKSAIKTPCKPMSEYLTGHAVIDFFSLDVEGAELTVLETIDWSAVRIDVLMIEMDHWADSNGRNSRIRTFVEEKGYVACGKVQIFRSGLFVRKGGVYEAKC